ncbi:40663_t:CDS:2, partial [Gigaspora margarita]
MKIQNKYPITKEFLTLLAELQKVCPGNLENIKFTDGKAEIKKNFANFNQKNLRNKKVQSFSELVDIPTDSSASITIQYDNNQHVSTCKQLQQQATPLMFSEMSECEFEASLCFGHDEKLKSQNDNDKRYCLLLLSTLQNWAFANKYPQKILLEQIENFNLVGESSTNDDNIRQVKKSKLEKEEKDPKWQKIADLLLTSGVEVSHSANQLVISENNNSIEFGDDANSIKMGLVQWKSRDDFLHLTQNRLDLEKLKHFLNLKQAYTAYKKF